MADDYQVGDLMNILSSRHDGTEKTEKKKILKQKKKLAALFSAANKQVSSPTDSFKMVIADKVLEEKTSVDEVTKRTKRKNENNVVEVASKKVKVEEKDHPEEKTAAEKQVRKKKRRRDKSKDSRTIFVGNLPVDMERKILKKLFKYFGPVDNVRLRCPPPAKQGMPKKVVAIKKDFHADRNNLVGFVCFETEESAHAALKMNGYKVKEHKIRVDMADNNKKHDHKQSVFLGNLPLNIQEDEIYLHFRECGKIENVRLVRDKITGIGKGFGYVAFKEADGVDLALKLNKTNLKGRELRVMRCQSSTKGSTSGAAWRIKLKMQLNQKKMASTKSFEGKKEPGGNKKMRLEEKKITSPKSFEGKKGPGGPKKKRLEERKITSSKSFEGKKGADGYKKTGKKKRLEKRMRSTKSFQSKKVLGSYKKSNKKH